MQHPDPIREDFIRSVKRPEPAMDLARTALIVAAEYDPDVDVDGVIHTLDSWAEELKRRLDPDWNNLQKLARLRSFVYEELGFKGERRDYYNPNNFLANGQNVFGGLADANMMSMPGSAEAGVGV